MQQVISQIRKVLGASNGESGNITMKGVSFLPAPLTGITAWEVDVLVRSWSYRHLQIARQTLNSIVDLVNDMSHMSVLERIGQNVELSLRACQKAYASISIASYQEVNITDILYAARQAAAFSDLAYYDPTMVPQLYFPSEHLYAVYVPFLLPVLLPLIKNLVSEIKRFRKKRAAAQS